MTEILVQHIEFLSTHAHVWGFVIIFVLMAIESSFIPLPSEVIMIPAGFLAYRGALSFGSAVPDAITAVIAGTVGSVAGALFCYYFALWLGRPILYTYGRYFFIKPRLLKRSERVFRRYGDITIFICRLIPGIRHLISIPAGLSRMCLFRFSFFTMLGAGIWVLILTSIGYYLGHISENMSYAELVKKGEKILSDNYLLIILGLLVIVIAYIFFHYRMTHGKEDNQPQFKI